MAEQNQSDLVQEPPIAPDSSATDALLSPQYRAAFAEQEAKQKPLIEQMGAAEMEKARIEREGVESGQTKMKEGFATYQEQIKAPQEFIRKGFEPTRENATDLTALFATTAIAAFMGGGGGRYSGMAALNNMAGAMEGYRKGRRDLFERELKEFDKNFKAAQTALQTASDELKSVVEIAKLDPILAQAKSKEYAAKYAGTKLAYDFNKGSFDQKIKTSVELDKAAAKMKEALNKIENAGLKPPALKTEQFTLRRSVDKRIDTAIQQINQAAGQGLGLQTLLNEQILTRIDPEGVGLRSILASIDADYRFSKGGKALTKNENEILKGVSDWRGKNGGTIVTQLQQLKRNIAVDDQIDRETYPAFAKMPPLTAVGGGSAGTTDSGGGLPGSYEREARSRFGAYEPNKYTYGFENGRFYREPK